MSNDKKEFYDRLEDVRAGMLGLTSGGLIPMSPNFDDDEPDAMWFITSQGNHIADALAAGAQDGRFVVSDGKAGLYADVAGTLTLSEDKAKLDEIWSGVAAAWFEDDKQDPDLRLVKFTLSKAEAWITTTSGLKFFYEIIKANVTDEMPDTGKQITLTF